jgi:hypothetical protein
MDKPSALEMVFALAFLAAASYAAEHPEAIIDPNGTTSSYATDPGLQNAKDFAASTGSP